MRTCFFPSSSIETLESRIAPAGLSAKAGALSIVPVGGLIISPTFAGPSTVSPEPLVILTDADLTGVPDNTSLIKTGVGTLQLDDSGTFVLIDAVSSMNGNAINHQINSNFPSDSSFQWFAPALVQELTLAVKPIVPELALVPEVLLPRFYF